MEGELVKTQLQNSMLFELSIVAAEDLLEGCGIEWSRCLREAVRRQRDYFDAQIPTEINAHARNCVLQTAENLRAILDEALTDLESLEARPTIPGFGWISSGTGDFATNSTIIEVKCHAKNFSTADYRQLLLYWFLKYVKSMESGQICWSHGVLVNPRLGTYSLFRFDTVLPMISGPRQRIDLVQSFNACVLTE